MFPFVFAGAIIASAVAWERGLSPFYVMVAVSGATLAVVALAERLMPFHKEWNHAQGDVGIDMIHGVVSNLTLPFVYRAAFALLLLPVARALEHVVGGAIWPTAWPLAAQVILAAVAAELCQYWVHRAAHETQWLWRLHAVHHSPKRLYWLNAGRDHPLGLLILFGAETSALMLLGAPDRVFFMQGVLTVVVGLFQHANIDLKLGIFNYIFSLNELHRWHHDENVTIANHNYGSNLSVWDWIFGTAYRGREGTSPTVGISGLSIPENYGVQLLVPFRWEQAQKETSLHKG